MASIRKRNGRYQAQIRLPGKPAISKTFNYKQDAQRWARDTERRLEQGELYVPTEAIRFQELIDRYTLSHLPLLKSTKQEKSLARRVSARLSNTFINEITNQRLAYYRDARIKEVSAQTVKHEINFVRRILKLAQSEWGVKMPQGIPSIRLPRLPAGRTRRINEAELQRIRNELRPLIADIVRLALETGMRRGEIISLRKDDIDWKTSAVLLRETKNGSVRRIPLTAVAREIVNRHKEHLPFPIKADSVSQAFERACKRAGVFDARFHDLRHEALSRFFEKGLNVPQVASISGHKDYRMLARYVHVEADLL